jgi:hypothetical protein
MGEQFAAVVALVGAIRPHHHPSLTESFLLSRAKIPFYKIVVKRKE